MILTAIDNQWLSSHRLMAPLTDPQGPAGLSEACGPRAPTALPSRAVPWRARYLRRNSAFHRSGISTFRIPGPPALFCEHAGTGASDREAR